MRRQVMEPRTIDGVVMKEHVRKGRFDLYYDDKYVGEVHSPEATGLKEWVFLVSIEARAASLDEAHGRAAALFHASREG